MASKTFKTSETVDFVVVGSGASGGIMARELSRAGMSVVVMEQGPRMNPWDFEHDELKYRQLSGITNNPTTNPQTFRRDASQTAVQPGRQEPADLRAHRRRQQRALQRQLLAPARDRLHRGQQIRRYRGRQPGRLADHLRRARTVLHDG
jgi:choline dehydrogenase-like flavoprotein